jgi:hypothetical protein
VFLDGRDKPGQDDIFLIGANSNGEDLFPAFKEKVRHGWRSCSTGTGHDVNWINRIQNGFGLQAAPARAAFA